MSSTYEKPEISCAGGCSLKTDEPESTGWELLPITGRYRCGQCTRELKAASQSGSDSSDEINFKNADTGMLAPLPHH